MIKFHCRCGKKLGAPEEKIGQKTKCPSCGEKITIPGPESEDDVAAAPIARTVKAPVTIQNPKRGKPKPAPEPEPEGEAEPEEKPARRARGAGGAARGAAGRATGRRNAPSTRRAEPPPEEEDEAPAEESGEGRGSRRAAGRRDRSGRAPRTGGRSARRGAVSVDPEQLDELVDRTFKYGLLCFVFAPYFAFKAIGTGKLAKAAARAGGNPLPGKATFGILMGWLSVASWILTAIAILVIVVFVGAAASSVKKDLDKAVQESQRETTPAK